MNMCRSCVWMAGFLLVLALGLGANAANGVSCADAITRLMPCQPFLTGASGGITVPCCDGAASLDQLIIGSDRAEIKTLCGCLKQAATAMGVNPARAKQIPQLCNITVPVPIDPNVNCDSV